MRDRASAMTFVWLLMCCMLSSMSWLAVMSHKLRKRRLKNGSLPPPERTTCTTAQLSQWITTPVLAKSAPHSLRATMRFNISRCTIECTVNGTHTPYLPIGPLRPWVKHPNRCVPGDDLPYERKLRHWRVPWRIRTIGGPGGRVDQGVYVFCCDYL